MARLVLLLCCGLIFWLYRTDGELRKLPSPALWIPALWLALISSKPVWIWLSALGLASYGRGEKGYSDEIVISVLIGLALVVLSKRSLSWAQLIGANKALIL